MYACMYMYGDWQHIEGGDGRNAKKTKGGKLGSIRYLQKNVGLKEGVWRAKGTVDSP